MLGNLNVGGFPLVRPMVQFDSCRFALVVGCAGFVCPEPAFPRICGHRVRRGPWQNSPALPFLRPFRRKK